MYIYILTFPVIADSSPSGRKHGARQVHARGARQASPAGRGLYRCLK